MVLAPSIRFLPAWHMLVLRDFYVEMLRGVRVSIYRKTMNVLNAQCWGNFQW